MIKHSIEYHLENATVEIRRLFQMLNPKIMEQPYSKIYATGNYIGYKIGAGSSPFVEMHFRKKSNKIELHLRPIDYSSSKLTISRKPDSHGWKLNTIIDIINNEEIESALDLIKQSYRHVVES